MLFTQKATGNKHLFVLQLSQDRKLQQQREKAKSSGQIPGVVSMVLYLVAERLLNALQLGEYFW